jgi:hypothetical protein
MTEEEQALYEELERQTGGKVAAPIAPASQTSHPAVSSTAAPESPQEPTKEPAAAAPRRSELEPG